MVAWPKPVRGVAEQRQRWDWGNRGALNNAGNALQRAADAEVAISRQLDELTVRCAEFGKRPLVHESPAATSLARRSPAGRAG